MKEYDNFFTGNKSIPNSSETKPTVSLDQKITNNYLEELLSRE